MAELIPDERKVDLLLKSFILKSEECSRLISGPSSDICSWWTPIVTIISVGQDRTAKFIKSSTHGSILLLCGKTLKHQHVSLKFQGGLRSIVIRPWKAKEGTFPLMVKLLLWKKPEKNCSKFKNSFTSPVWEANSSENLLSLVLKSKGSYYWCENLRSVFKEVAGKVYCR